MVLVVKLQSMQYFLSNYESFMEGDEFFRVVTAQVGGSLDIVLWVRSVCTHKELEVFMVCV